MTAPVPDDAGAPPVRRRPRGLSTRLALIAGALLVFTSLVFLILVTTSYRARILAAHERASMSVNLTLQAALENAMIKRDLPGLHRIVEKLGTQEGITGVAIVNPGGEIRFSSDPDLKFTALDEPVLERAFLSQTRQAAFRTDAGGLEILRSVNPVHNQPACQQCHGPLADHPVNGLLVVDYEASDVRREARSGALMLGASGVLVLLVLEGGLWIALRRLVLAPVARLTESTGRIASGDLTARTAPSGTREFDRLAGSFNDMAARLQRLIGDLRDSRTFLQNLIDAIPDGVRVIGPDYRIVMANAAYCDQIGARHEDVVGALCYVSSHKRKTPCAPTLVCCPLADLAGGGKPRVKCHHIHIDDHGGEMPVEVNAAPIALRIGGEKRACIAESIRDLDAQLSISQNQRLSELGLLAAGVAHEVNNPLSSVQLALSAIAKEPDQSARTRRYVDLAAAEIANCQRFTESLLRLAVPPRAGLEIVELGAVIPDVLALVRLQAEQGGVEIVADVEGRPCVLGRDSDLRTLIFNLVLNALHAMPSGGVVTVTAASAEGRVTLAVADTGVGIPRRDYDKILLPFWTRRADGHQGRGLGLTICKTIVDRMGGSFRFESVVNSGTTFTIDLPDADESTS